MLPGTQEALDKYTRHGRRTVPPDSPGLPSPGDDILAVTHGLCPIPGLTLPHPGADSAHDEKEGTATMTAARECGSSLGTPIKGQR